MDRKYDMAVLSESELEAVRKAESDVKAATGRDLVLIAWNEVGLGSRAESTAGHAGQSGKVR